MFRWKSLLTIQLILHQVAVRPFGQPTRQSLGIWWQTPTHWHDSKHLRLQVFVVSTISICWCQAIGILSCWRASPSGFDGKLRPTGTTTDSSGQSLFIQQYNTLLASGHCQPTWQSLGVWWQTPTHWHDDRQFSISSSRYITHFFAPETYFFQFCPDKTGRNWTKLEKTMKGVRNAGKYNY